jgi:hypothetical protein
MEVRAARGPRAQIVPTELAKRKLRERHGFAMVALGVVPSRGIAADNLTEKKEKERAREQRRFIFARYQATVRMVRNKRHGRECGLLPRIVKSRHKAHCRASFQSCSRIEAAHKHARRKGRLRIFPQALKGKYT